MNRIIKNSLITAFASALLLSFALNVNSYPIDGYPETGIARLEYYRLAQDGEIQGTKLFEGAKLHRDQVLPRLLDRDASDPLQLPPVDEALSRELKTHIPSQPNNYSIAILDLTNPDQPAYIEHNGDYESNVGSVGKMLVATAMFAKLKDVYPNDIEKRRAVLKNTNVIADQFSLSDHHTVRFYDVDTRKLERHSIKPGDQGSLYEFLDWMLSPSSNSAAAMVQRELILLSHFRERYPVSETEIKQFFADTKKTELKEIFLDAMITPIKELGLDTDKLRQGSFFTYRGKELVPGTNSIGNPRELIRLLFLIEQGKLLDQFSSIEMKRLLYLTERRIRYASHPVLHPFALYFKTGSLYSCEPEEGFTCGQYKGNKRNILASVAIVEAPAVNPEYHYMVVVQSNVLKVNSAVAHQTLALRVHRMIESIHQAKE